MQNISSNELARPVMGTIFLVNGVSVIVYTVEKDAISFLFCMVFERLVKDRASVRGHGH